jgi:hypothetical protein
VTAPANLERIAMSTAPAPVAAPAPVLDSGLDAATSAALKLIGHVTNLADLAVLIAAARARSSAIECARLHNAVLAGEIGPGHRVAFARAGVVACAVVVKVNARTLTLRLNDGSLARVSPADLCEPPAPEPAPEAAPEPESFVLVSGPAPEAAPAA